MRTSRISIIFVLLIGFNFHSFTQTFTKNGNGYFNGVIEQDVLILSGTSKKGLIDDYRVSFNIGELLGDPKVDYAFAWKMDESTSIKYEYHSVSINSLKKYPDLYKKIKQIRPGNNIMIQCRFKFYYEVVLPTVNSKKLETFCIKYIDMKIDLPSVANESSYSVPSAPSWDELLQETNRRDLNGTWHEYEISNKDLFRRSYKIELQGFPEITKIEWPESQMKKIAREYLCREKKLEECKEKEEEKQESKESEDDFWSLGKETKSNEPETKDNSSAGSGSTQDNFWNDFDEKSEPTTSNTTTSKSDGDYWNDFKEDDDENKDSFWDNPGSGSNNDDFWNNPSSNSGEFEVKEGDNDKYGIADKLSKKLLVPYEYDHIFFVKEGLAKVAKLQNTEKEKFCDTDLCEAYYDIYFIDMKNNRVSEIEKALNIYKYTPFYITLTRSYYGETESERRSREAKEERRKRESERKQEDCRRRRNEKTKRVKQNFINSGGIIIDKFE